jgi:pimeloyl-ACP methyl ester carboxylesterase
MMSIMGVPKSIQKNLTTADKKWLDDSMFAFLPVSLRTNGIINDIWVTNPDLNKDYPYKELTVPTLIIHAVDDPMPPFTIAKRIAEQIPDSKFLAIERGGHLHIGHQSIIRSSMSEFITNTNKTVYPLTYKAPQSAAPKMADSTHH